MMEANIPSTTSLTQTEVLDGPATNEVAVASEPVLRLRLRKPKSDRKVAFKEGTVDNEHMNKKKSKCCCIYKKPSTFGESSSESEDECEHCVGHTEVKREKRLKKSDDDSTNTTVGETTDCPAVSSTATPPNAAKPPPAEPSNEPHGADENK